MKKRKGTASSFMGFVKKEFLHIFRDRRSAAILFGMPIIQLLLFGYAIRNEINEVKIAVSDLSHDSVTRGITNTLLSSGTFVLAGEPESPAAIARLFAGGGIDEAIVFEPGFGVRLERDRKAELQVITDGSDPNVSRIITGYTTAAVLDYLRQSSRPLEGERGVVAEPLMMFNPSLKSVYLFVPGLMAMILMLVSALMTSISITREKESGTMEVLLVSSLRPVQIILGKVVPYFILSFVNVVSIVAIASVVFGVPCRGSYLLLLMESLLFIMTALSLGIFISTMTNSQQVAMMISLGGLLLPTILLSGFIFPVESMPLPLQVISNIIPARWYLEIVRAIMLKGAGISILWQETLVLVVMTGVLVAASVRKFKERLQ
ncbi:ABC transporter permease [Pelodictyon luteolum]|uniref:Transport permease protein n=1 Tax=Chlorobium luteolum (strain DSM 273 / BCRC 81028 / 2530) TaxID=319225 RepID=Q3B3Z0_CHLL3|nr:ABC transporter permease [Pelodictyon luteolum]ABB23941.1 putative ABC transporter ATP-binding protein or permease protein [Pelodictyon luteolum DSM 273]